MGKVDQMRGVARHPSALIFMLAALAAIAVGIAGLGRPLENWLSEQRDAVATRDATGQIVVVEMDAASIAALKRWPWPRRNYAHIVDALDRAGARTIAFDVDFSAVSNREDDRLLAESILRARSTVVLPTFRQRAKSADGRQIDSLPLAELRENATLAAVAVAPDRDGMVRRMPLGTMTAGTPRPSLSAFIGRRSGAADADFSIDFSVRPLTVPRLSFIDVAQGRIDPRQVAGRDILIGATAIEMGDRYAVPRYGVLPGVIIQAMAAETLIRGIPLQLGWLPGTITALIMCMGLARCRTLAEIQTASIVAGLGIFAMAVVLDAIWGAVADILPGLVAIGTVGLGVAIRMIRAQRAYRQSHDLATGMPNRIALIDHEVSPRELALVVATIQGFDRLATVLGPTGTTALVTRIAERITFASDRATMYRIEDRTIAWTMCAVGAEAAARLDAVAAMMLNPVEIGGRSVDVALACGLAVGDNAADLLSRASLAASEAADAHVPWRIASADKEELAWQVSLMGELSAAILERQIEVVYQPKLDIAAGTISSLEALVRWRHPVRGYLRPDVFIPMAEENDRILGLTLCVLERVLCDLRQWMMEGRVVKAAVNISATLVASRAFADEVKSLLANSQVPTSQLIFEITESATISNPKEAVAALIEFRDMGIAISMDDYGTGQSTLTYLRDLPLSELKIDRSFVQHAHINPNDAVLVRSTVDLAHKLGLKVVAEGVEDEGCLDFLRTIGCDMAQGYLIAKPSPRAMALEINAKLAA
ncbi:putative bifunctional diguanylate cyclase/phosphodiesterase [Sphingomonas gilva]|nr:EAL domain-containing protein [Sphingomonas gilva]